MKVKDVARLLGESEETVRAGILQGYYPFGVAFKVKATNKRYKYTIFDEKVREYIASEVASNGN